MSIKKTPDERCSFCGKPLSSANHVAGADGTFICDECVEEISKTFDMQRQIEEFDKQD